MLEKCPFIIKNRERYISPFVESEKNFDRHGDLTNKLERLDEKIASAETSLSLKEKQCKINFDIYFPVNSEAPLTKL